MAPTNGYSSGNISVTGTFPSTSTISSGAVTAGPITFIPAQDYVNAYGSTTLSLPVCGACGAFHLLNNAVSSVMTVSAPDGNLCPKCTVLIADLVSICDGIDDEEFDELEAGLRAFMADSKPVSVERKYMFASISSSTGYSPSHIYSTVKWITNPSVYTVQPYVITTYP